MTHTVTIQLNQAIKSAALMDAPEGLSNAQAGDPSSAGADLSESASLALDGRQAQLDQTCQTLDGLAAKLEQLQAEMIQSHRKQIARLAVDIARKILVQKVKDKDYEIETIVQEALGKSPTPQGIVVHLHPDDLPACQQVQQQHPDGPFAHVQLLASHAVGQAECMLETPKGMIKSFIDEQLETIAQALEKAH